MLSSALQKIQSIVIPQDQIKDFAWMRALNDLDELGALKVICTQLAKVRFNEPKQLKLSADLLLGIDRKTYKIANTITYKYLTDIDLNAKNLASMHALMLAYQTQLSAAYTQLIGAYFNQTQIVFSEPTLLFIASRYLNATFLMAKWCYFDDQPVPEGTWRNVYKIVRYVENLSLLNANLFLYDNQAQETSVANILVQGFMMDSLQRGNYTRLQIELCQKVLSTWATNPTLFRSNKQGAFQFFIDIESDNRPNRIRAMKPNMQHRFWKTAPLIDKIEAYLCAVNTQKSLEAFGLEKIAPSNLVIDLFKKLRADWCVEGYQRQRRKEARYKQSRLIVVNYGLDSICKRIEAAQLVIASPPSTLTVDTENWLQVDESESGIGVDLGKIYSDWVVLGQLVAYASHDDKTRYHLAEIKSLRKQTNGHYRAGLQLLSKHAMPVQLGRISQPAVSKTEAYSVDDSEIAQKPIASLIGLLLNTQAGDHSLIVPSQAYKRGNILSVNINGSEQMVKMGTALTKQRDWVRVALPA